MPRLPIEFAFLAKYDLAFTISTVELEVYLFIGLIIESVRRIKY
jgi:hypothetical protein